MRAAQPRSGRRGNFYVDRHPKPEVKEKVKRHTLVIPWQRLKKCLLGVCILVSLAGLALGIGKIFVWLYDVAVTSDFFTTHVIEVSGNVRLPRDVVLDYAGIREGQNSLAVNIASVEQNLRRTPWVESVSVKRLLPDKFVIRIHERMPSFWVHRDGVLYYASEEGEIIAPVESSNFLSLPALSVEQGADQLRPYLARFKESVRTGDLPVDVAQVSQITLSLSKGLELFLEDRELWLSFDPRDWEKNVLRIKRVFADLIKRREMKNVREMRVVEGNVWLVLNQSAKQLPGVQ